MGQYIFTKVLYRNIVFSHTSLKNIYSHTKYIQYILKKGKRRAIYICINKCVYVCMYVFVCMYVCMKYYNILYCIVFYFSRRVGSQNFYFEYLCIYIYAVL